MDIRYNFTIYKIVNPNGAVYVGKTNNYKKRLNYYRNNNCEGQKKLYNSFKKHGFDNHEFVVLEEFVSNVSYCNSKELFWIKTYMSNACKYPFYNGLNLTDGGEGSLGYKASPELRKRLSKYHKSNPSRGMLGKKLTDDQKKHLSEIAKKNPPMHRLGKKMSEETKDKILATKKAKYKYTPRTTPIKEETKIKMSMAKIGKPTWNKGIKMTEEQKKNMFKFKKGVTSFNKGKKFQGSDEERKIKFGAHNIGNSYNKGRKVSPEVLKNMSERMMKKISQFDLSGRFISDYDSIKQASLKLGISRDAIGRILRGEAKQFKSGYIFKYKGK